MYLRQHSIMESMVGLDRVERSTFPILSGRSNQRFDVTPALHAFDLTLSRRCFASSLERLGVAQVPGSTVSDRCSAIIVVLEDAFAKIFGMADIETAGRPATNDVCAKTHGFRWWAWTESNGRPHPYQGCALTN